MTYVRFIKIKISFNAFWELLTCSEYVSCWLTVLACFTGQNFQHECIWVSSAKRVAADPDRYRLVCLQLSKLLDYVLHVLSHAKISSPVNVDVAIYREDISSDNLCVTWCYKCESCVAKLMLAQSKHEDHAFLQKGLKERLKNCMKNAISKRLSVWDCNLLLSKRFSPKPTIIRV